MADKVIIYRSQYEQMMDEFWMNPDNFIYIINLVGNAAVFIFLIWFWNEILSSYYYRLKWRISCLFKQRKKRK